LLKKNIESRPQRPPQQERKRIKKDERQQGGQQVSKFELKICFDFYF